MEVLVSVAVAGLVITAGFRLVAMSYRLLGELRIERELSSAAKEIWLRFRIDEEMPDSGTDDEKGISWRTQEVTVPVDEYELTFKRVTVSIASGQETIIYVSK